MIPRLLLALMFAKMAFAELPLMPWPQSIQQSPGAFAITQEFSVSVSGTGAKDERVTASVQRLFDRLTRETGIPVWPHVVAEGGTLQIVVEGADHRAPQRPGDDESYSLRVEEAHARLSSNGPLGIVRGLETFLQLVQQNETPARPGFSVPVVTIKDAPRFPWRGLSLDVSRHFIPVSGVERTIDGLSAVKMNVLHWHLSDDQGFRVESKKFPRLQQAGSDGFFYTQAEIRGVLAYARQRGVRIVPEFDMPGHATSWLAAYPTLGAGSGYYVITRGGGILNDLIDPTKESTYRFLDGFIGEMSKLFPDEYFHIGGDEVNARQWMENPHIRSFMTKHHIGDAKALQVYFNGRLLRIVTKYHKRMEGWDEVLQPNLPKSIVIQSWRGQESLWKAASEGYQGILSAGYYLDLMYPASKHYAVDPMIDPKTGAPATLTPEQRQLVLGGEAAMWEELATEENLDVKLWPRTAVIAERLWSPESVKDVDSMYARLQPVSTWLEFAGMQHRTSLQLMRERLVGVENAKQLEVFTSMLEPVKGYKRHAEKYNILTPFNRLVDSIPPESEPARRFAKAVDDYVSGRTSDEGVREVLLQWQASIRDLRAVMARTSVLLEVMPVADQADQMCSAGLAALANGAKQDIELPKAEPRADMVLIIEPAIRALIEHANKSH